MTSLRVLQVHRDFAPDRGGGGVARHIHGLATVAARAGLTVRVVAPNIRPPQGDHGYEVRPCGFSGLWRQIGWADVVHVHGARNPIAAAAALIALAKGRRLVYTPHCYYDGGSLLNRALKHTWDLAFERLLLRRSAATVLLAPFWLDALKQRGLLVASPLIVPNCVLAASHLSQPARATPLRGSPALLSLGRLDAVKRLDDAIAALRQRRLAAAVLHVVGTGPDRARLEAAARSAGVAERVMFYGFVPDEQVAAMAAAADCFVMTSGQEGGPTVLIEMMLMGRPVVASDIPGNRAILAAAGWEAGLYEMGDVAGLARTIGHVLAAPPAAEVTARARDHFTWEPRMSEIVGLYTGPCAGESGSQAVLSQHR
jgi:glycosyltransferase involved in cell wall biosynthesis